MVVILALLGIVAVGVHRHRVNQATVASPLYNDKAPIAKGAPRISVSVLRLLTSADFTVVTNLRYLPSRVKESFCNVEDCNYGGTKFDMVNPGETMSTDYILPGVPNKRLVFAALNKDSSVVVYEHGGFVNVLRTTIFDFRKGSSWDATLYVRVRDLQHLRIALAQEKYGIRQTGRQLTNRNTVTVNTVPVVTTS